jgi:photosystem II stability/assembly factor-like uncharacterized protein
VLVVALTLGGHAGPSVFASVQAPGQWTRIAPELVRGNPLVVNGGRVASISVNPADPRHWLVGIGNGGVWDTRDGGATWTPLAHQAPTLAIGAVAFAPSNPEIVYAATGEASAEFFTMAGVGLLRSSDGGRHWAHVGEASLRRTAVRSMRVHPTNPNVIVATASRGGAGRDSRFGGAHPSAPFGVLRSNDGGATWVRTLPGMAIALEVDPTNFNNQYAAIGEQALGPSGINQDAVGSVANGLYRSGDGGLTWTPVTGPWGDSTPTRPTTGRVALAIAPSNPNVLYAGMQKHRLTSGGASDLLGLYRTDNAWAATPAWVEVPRGPTAAGGGYCGGDKCGYTHVLSVDPADPNRLFAGGARIWMCTNCGASPTWANVQGGQGGLHADFHAMAWAGNRLIVGTDGGVWSSTTFGATWQSHNVGLPTLMFYSGALHPTNPNFILGGLRDFPPAVLRGGSESWFAFPELPSPLHWGEAEVAVSSARPDTDWMIGDLWGGIYRTLDGGQSAVRTDEAIDKTSSSFVPPVRKCPTNDNVFVTGHHRVWRTNNFFSSVMPDWVPNGPPSAYPNQRQSLGTIQTIAFSPSSSACDTYAYGNHAGEVRLTRDGGHTWTDLDPQRMLPRRTVNSIAFDPANANVAYVALSGFDEATIGAPGHVFKSTNAMAASPSWANVSPPSNQPFNVIAVDPGSPSLVYAGSDTGLWWSTNAAASWQRVGLEQGIPPGANVYDIQINRASGRTVVFTYGLGAFALMPSP